MTAAETRQEASRGRPLTVVVAAPEYDREWPVLQSLRACGVCGTSGSANTSAAPLAEFPGNSSKAQPSDHLSEAADVPVILALGNHPARQRNEASAHVATPFCLFLDSDVSLPVETLRAYIRLAEQQATGDHADKDSLDVIGGPVLLHDASEAGCKQRLFQETLATPLITGASAARYRPVGSARPTTEAELILCNLLVRTELLRADPFNPQLYPNEENEWIDRVQRQGATVRYDPVLSVERPQRATWRAYLWMLWRYGEGRTRQSLIARRFSIKQLPAIGLGLGLLLIGTTTVGLLLSDSLAVWWPWFALMLALGVTGMTGLICALALGPTRSHQPLAVTLCGIATVLAYAGGQLWGLLSWWLPTQPSQSVRVVNGNGQAV